jgi:hypothetical protein
MVTILGNITDLSGITINEGVTEENIATPYISVNASRDAERVRGGGAYDFTVMIDLFTTIGEGPKASTDAQLLTLDAAIEEALFEVDVYDLADVLTANAQDVRVDAVFGPTSEATEFNQSKRNITYQFNCVAMRVASA